MSRSKAVEDEEVLPVLEGEDKANASTDTVPSGDKSEAKTTVKSESPAESKIGVVRFLQLNPQPKMVADLMKSMYKSEVHTESEWFEIMNKLLGKSVVTRR